MLYPCPACGFEVFDKPAGSYDLCPVCDWEDDEIQLRFPAMRGGANTVSLFEWQQKVLQRLPPEMIAHEGFHRCCDWRPLTQMDLSEGDSPPMTGLEHFEPVGTEEAIYYWHRIPIRINPRRAQVNSLEYPDLMDEQSLIEKLVTLWHLSVAERRALPNQTAKVSMVCRAIANYLSERTSYPQDWTTGEGFDGGLIELRSDGSCDIHWMAEVGMMRFELQETVHHDDALDAAKAWLKRMFPKDIDGVPLNWNA